ncbi:tRNA lysidine(34) synthetase TilS [Myroides sp. LJL116]
MIEEFKKHLTTHFAPLFNAKLLLAISAGVDSVALCHLCKALNLDISLAHCNFHLRDSFSNEDQRFVEDLGKDLNLEVFVKEFDTVGYAKENKQSIQIAARELRYTWFESLAKQHGFDFVLTAHHLDDSIETFFIHLSRGTGIEGLTGIPSSNKSIVRPLLAFTRENIMAYMLANNYPWREDHTNAQNKYLRNKIRNQIVPLFRELPGDFTSAFSLTQENLKQSFQLSQDAQKWAYEKVVHKKGDGLYFNIEQIKQLSNAKAYLYQWLQPYGFSAWSDIVDLLDARSGKHILAKEYILLKDREYLILKKADELNFEAHKEYSIDNNTYITDPIKLEMKSCSKDEVSFNNNVVYLDADKLSLPLKIRKVQPTDRFMPLGMKGTKKVSKFFKDQKLDLFQKKQTWVVTSKDQIVWVIAHRLDDRFKVTSSTQNIIKLELTV